MLSRPVAAHNQKYGFSALAFLPGVTKSAG
jgi:hypothetical protein